MVKQWSCHPHDPRRNPNLKLTHLEVIIYHAIIAYPLVLAWRNKMILRPYKFLTLVIIGLLAIPFISGCTTHTKMAIDSAATVKKYSKANSIWDYIRNHEDDKVREALWDAQYLDYYMARGTLGVCAGYLHVAAYYDNPGAIDIIMKYLVDHDKDRMVKERFDQLLDSSDCRMGPLNILPETRAPYRSESSKFVVLSTPLHVAAEYGNEAAFLHLLELGADPNKSDFVIQIPSDELKKIDASELFDYASIIMQKAFRPARSYRTQSEKDALDKVARNYRPIDYVLLSKNFSGSLAKRARFIKLLSEHKGGLSKYSLDSLTRRAWFTKNEDIIEITNRYVDVRKRSARESAGGTFARLVEAFVELAPIGADVVVKAAREVCKDGHCNTATPENSSQVSSRDPKENDGSSKNSRKVKASSAAVRSGEVLAIDRAGYKDIGANRYPKYSVRCASGFSEELFYNRKKNVG